MLPKMNKILYASDLGNGTLDAFRLAVSIARQYNAEIVFTHAIEPMGTTAENVIRNHIPKSLRDELKTSGMDSLKEKMEQRLLRFYREELPEGIEFPHGEPTIRVVEGTPDRVVLRVAEEEDVNMIVMGSRTHTRLGQILLGSNANKIIHQSKRPVLVVPLEKE